MRMKRMKRTKMERRWTKKRQGKKIRAALTAEKLLQNANTLLLLDA